MFVVSNCQNKLVDSIWKNSEVRDTCIGRIGRWTERCVANFEFLEFLELETDHQQFFLFSHLVRALLNDSRHPSVKISNSIFQKRVLVRIVQKIAKIDVLELEHLTKVLTPVRLYGHCDAVLEYQ